MAAVEYQIWMAIKSRVETLLPTIKKAWPAEVFIVPSDSSGQLPFLRIGRVTIAPHRVFLADGMPQDRVGALMITVVYPLSRNMPSDMYPMLGADVANHFPEGTKMSFENVTVNIEKTPHVQDGYEDNGYWNIPVRISWRCFA